MVGEEGMEKLRRATRRRQRWQIIVATVAEARQGAMVVCVDSMRLGLVRTSRIAEVGAGLPL